MENTRHHCNRAHASVSVQPIDVAPVPYRHVDDEHRRVFLLTRTPAGCVSSHRMLLQLEPELLSPCLETARAAGKAIGRRLCSSTRLFAARSTSPQLCPVLECPARLGCSRPRLETRSVSLSPRRRPPLQCLCTTRRLTLSPPPSSSNRWPASPPSRAAA